MISLRSFPIRNVRYHWTSNLPVLLGVAIGAAVLTGALIIGDSLRGSLKERALRQLNGVEADYQGLRLIRSDLANELPGQVSAALLMQGSIQCEDREGKTQRLARVNVIGLSQSGRERLGLPAVFDFDSDARSVLLSHRVARELGVEKGGIVSLGVQKFSNIPRSSALGKRTLDDVSAVLRVNVAGILEEADTANDFNLTPSPAPPMNVFVPLKFLQTRLDATGKANTLFAEASDLPVLNAAFAEKLTLEDWGLTVRVAPKRQAYVTIESDHLTLPAPVVHTIEAVAKQLGTSSQRTNSYLANAIVAGSEPMLGKDPGKGREFIPYSIITALNPTAKAPLGPFLPPGVTTLADDEIVLVDWPESPLKSLNAGQAVTISYFKPEMEAKVEEGDATFRFRGFVPLAGPADDPDLTPAFPGITDKLSIDDWNPPFELVNARIKPRDEKYWEKHRTTPKAYITQAAGERLFASRFGIATSVRLAPLPGLSVEQSAERVREALRKALDPESAGFRFEDTQARVLTASRGGTDFGLLFLMFSFLLIGAALLLVGLLFRLAVERRAKEVGLLLATGYSVRQVRNLLLVEGGAVAAFGTLIGLAGATAYAQFMLTFLGNLWPDHTVSSYLTLHLTAITLLLGFIATMLVAVGTIWFSVRGLVRIAPPALLQGRTQSDNAMVTPAPRLRFALGLGGLCALFGLGLLFLGTLRPNPDERAMCFFTGGGLLLGSGLIVARAWFRRRIDAVIQSRGMVGVASLGRRNIARNAGRSLLTATLIAGAAFLIVSVESFRRHTDADFYTKDGGSGGFALVAEADVPLFEPFDREPGRYDLMEKLQQVLFQPALQKHPTGPTIAEMRTDAVRALDTVKLFSFRLQGGDDASCMNLYQAVQPRILGVPNDLIERGGFQFAETTAKTEAERDNPLSLLHAPQEDGAIPVLAEQNTAMFMLKTMVGGTTTIHNADGEPVTVRIVGTLQDSVFQSELLMSDENFRKLYPRQEGYRVFLLDVPPEQTSEVSRLLELGLQDNGFRVTRSADRVAAFQQVVGAYLSTFQLLGGFALLLAVLGLGVVVLRSVWERVSELALLRAVGYRTRALQIMILTETLLVLLVGLLIGVLSALASVAPNLALGGSIPWWKVGLLVLAVGATGAVVAVIATAGVARAPLVPALRKE